MAKKIAVLGSTGSIGVNALRVIKSLGKDYELIAITGHNNTELLSRQAKEFKVKYVGITNQQKTDSLKQALGSSNNPKILQGTEAMEEIASLDEVDLVLAAVVGAAGLKAVLAAAKAGKTIAIANKEPLVIAGKLLIETAKQNNATILPVDSEHCAIFQCLASGKNSEVKKLILTASGGPFRKASTEEIKNATLEDALNHPTWDMGAKITIDSATMMNKALEVIEAKWLFDIDIDKIDVLIHPESIVHSLVEFIDGSVIAQMGSADMCGPIQYALTWPERKVGITKHLELEKLGRLTFEAPGDNISKALKIGLEVAKKGGSAPVVFNAANEAAVELFLKKAIKFPDIVELIAKCVSIHSVKQNLTLAELLETDSWARKQVINLANR